MDGDVVSLADVEQDGDSLSLDAMEPTDDSLSSMEPDEGSSAALEHDGDSVVLVEVLGCCDLDVASMFGDIDSSTDVVNSESDRGVNDDMTQSVNFINRDPTNRVIVS
jgi:hypothetical protein